MKWMVTMVLISFSFVFAQDGIFFSEYFEGTGERKAIEIYNGNAAVTAVNLNRLRVRVYNNGAATPNATLTLGTADDGSTTTLAWNSVFVIYRNSATGFPTPNTQLPNAPSSRRIGTTSNVTAFNGDDALELQYDTDGAGTWATADIFGVIGQDPGAFWSGGGIQTQDRSLERKSSVNTGVQTNPGSFDPSVQWNDNGNITDPVTTLGTHTTDSPLPVELSSFTAAAGNGVVTLRWVTQSEVNNERFDVLRAPERNGVYQVIGSRPGQGNSNAPTSYSFADNLVANGTTYWYKIADVDVNGVRTEHGPVSATPQAAGTEIITLNSDAPANFKIYPAYPNPFNPSTNLKFDIPAGSQGLQDVKVEIYNTIGQKIRTLFEGIAEPATHSLTWDGADDNGQTVPGGVYFAVLTTGHFRESVKLTLVK